MSGVAVSIANRDHPRAPASPGHDPGIAKTRSGCALVLAAVLALPACGPMPISESLFAAADTGIIVLNSPGGNADLGFRIAEHVRALRHRGHPLTATIAGECNSACILIFCEAEHRHAAPGATVGFHSAGRRIGAIRTTEEAETWRMLDQLRARCVSADFIAALQGRGVFIDGSKSEIHLATDVPGLLTP